MVKDLPYILVIFIALGCSPLKNTSREAKLDVAFVELGYGICETRKEFRQQMKSSPSGTRTLSSGFRLVDKTDKIPGKLGQTFGIEYILQANITQEIIVEQVWIFPSVITDISGNKFKEVKYSLEKTTNIKTYSTYVLEEDYEIV